MASEVIHVAEGGLAGRRALVVGFANAAGRVLALALAEAGADVAVASATLDGEEVIAAKSTARAVEKLGRRSFSQGWDVTLPTNVQVGLKQLEKTFGMPDILVFNADLPLAKPLGRITDSEFGRVQQANLAGAFYAARSFVRELKGTAPAALVYVVLPADAESEQSAYIAAKVGVAGLTRALGTELQAAGVAVNCAWAAPATWLGLAPAPAATLESLVDVALALAAADPSVVNGAVVQARFDPA